jgi:hypothetical protein
MTVAKMLTLDEMLLAFSKVDRPSYDRHVAAIKALGLAVAKDLGDALGIDPGIALDDMLLALFRIDRPSYDRHVKALKTVGLAVAKELGNALGISPGIADYDDGGLMVGFAPKYDGQPLPKAIKDFDLEGEWLPRALEGAAASDAQDLCLFTSHEVNTLLAALRFYQANGQGNAVNRSDDIHKLAVGDNDDISLDDEGIDALCEKINCGVIRGAAA